MSRLILAAATVALLLGVARSADACTDAGRGAYGSCYDASAWAPCTTHGDCTSAQRCYDAVCICAAACPFEEICEDAGCHCAKQPLNLPPYCAYDSGLCGAAQGIPGFVVCGNPDASTPVEGGTKDAAPSNDAGVSSSSNEGGCTTTGALGSAGGIAGPLATLALTALLAARRRRR
jgi:hypothetical protein